MFSSVVMPLFQTALPLELPQVKPKRSDEGKGLGMQLRGPLGPGGKGSVSELKSVAAGCPMYLGKDSPRPGPSEASQKPASPLQSAADHLEEELDLLLNLDAPVKAGDNISPDQTPQDLESEKDGEDVAQEERGTVFILLPVYLLDSGAFVRTASPASHPHTSPSVSDIDLALSTDSYFCAHISASPEPAFLATFLSRCWASEAATCRIAVLNPGLRTELVL